jgi:hypothetical protein
VEFLVLMKLTEDGVGKTEKESKDILKNTILPSIEMLQKMEKEGFLSGGFFEGQRSGAFVLSVESEDILDETLSELPCASIYQIEAVKLQSLSEALEQDKKALKPSSKK